MMVCADQLRLGKPGIAILAAALLLTGCQVRQPGGLESKVMQGTKRRLTVGGRSDVNPLPAIGENIRAGQRNFASYCMVCHGLDGQTTGVPFADKMAPPVPSLSSAPIQAYSDGQLHWIIQNGIFPSGMPAARGIFRDEEIWQMVLYIRHLPPKGSLGEPTVYGGEPNQQEEVRKVLSR
jgi:mono/diheme cytochrome c family protein